MSEPRLTYREMIQICVRYAGLPKGQIRIVAHELRPGTYGWEETPATAAAIQVSEMPRPCGDLFGVIYEYTGHNTEEFKTGHCYACITLIPLYEYIDFYNLVESNPRPLHRVRKFMGKWHNLF